MSRTESELKGVTLLGNTATRYPDQYAPEVLETFKNKHQDNEYLGQHRHTLSGPVCSGGA